MPKVNVFDKFVRVRPKSGRSIVQRELTVAANQTIRAGDLVKLNSGSLEQLAALNANANSTTAIDGVDLLGVALADITMTGSSETTTGRTKIPVAILDDNVEVAFRIYNSTAGDAEPQDVTIGTAYQAVRWTSNSNSVWWYAATTTTTNGTFRLVEKSQDSAAGDDYGICWYSVIAADQQG